MRTLKYLNPEWLGFTLFLSLLLISSNGVKAQEVSVTAQLDSTVIFIGGQIDLKLEVSQPENLNVTFPLLTDTITQNIEIVKAGSLDSIPQDNNRILLQQTYRITSFDSGLHYIPPIQFELANAELTRPIETEAMALMVVNPFEEVDPQKGITDIKTPLNTPFHLSELYRYWPYLVGLIVLGLIIALVVFRYYNREVNIPLLKKEKPKVAPHVVALNRLDHIKEEKLWQRDLVKRYYSDVTDTLRHYIEERFQIRAMEQTTDEIMDAFKSVDLREVKSIDNLKQILQAADLVKFAKHEPLPDENDLSMINAYFFVNQTKQEVMKSLEEEKADMLKQEEEAAPVKESTNS